MKKTLSGIVLSLLVSAVWGQTCTISGSGNVDWTAATCVETGLAPQSGDHIIIPLAVNLIINNVGGIPVSSTAFHTGDITVFGMLTNDKANAQLNGNVTIKSGGTVRLQKIFHLGHQDIPNCDYTINIESGGILELEGGGAADRLVICGNPVAQTGGGCNPYPEGPIPYCEPDGGFTGPIEFGKNGVTPVELIFFSAKKSGNQIIISWATSLEENFDHFVVQHAANGLNFSDLVIIQGAGYNTESRNDYSFTHSVPIIGYNYYRLKAVDLDGSYEYFGPVGEMFNGARALWVFPNPASGEQVSFKSNFSAGEGDRVQVISQLGSIMADVQVNDNKGIINFNEPLKPGAYILKYASANDVQFARFIVTKK